MAVGQLPVYTCSLWCGNNNKNNNYYITIIVIKIIIVVIVTIQLTSDIW